MKFCVNRRGNSTESEVFFNKMIADYYRFLGEFTKKDRKREYEVMI